MNLIQMYDENFCTRVYQTYSLTGSRFAVVGAQFLARHRNNGRRQHFVLIVLSFGIARN
jgi:hypothetical protein